MKGDYFVNQHTTLGFSLPRMYLFVYLSVDLVCHFICLAIVRGKHGTFLYKLTLELFISIHHCDLFR